MIGASWSWSDFYLQPIFWGEVAKAIATFIGALLISWLTVRWALARFKREKRWEREATAYADIIGVIGELIRWNGNASRTTDDQALRQSKWTEALIRFATVSATAATILPNDAVDVLEKLIDDLKPDEKFVFKVSDTKELSSERHATLDASYYALLALARRRLGSDAG